MNSIRQVLAVVLLATVFAVISFAGASLVLV